MLKPNPLNTLWEGFKEMTAASSFFLAIVYAVVALSMSSPGMVIQALFLWYMGRNLGLTLEAEKEQRLRDESSED